LESDSQSERSEINPAYRFNKTLKGSDEGLCRFEYELANWVVEVRIGKLH
jgi:hypothetical protein